MKTHSRSPLINPR